MKNSWINYFQLSIMFIFISTTSIQYSKLYAQTTSLVANMKIQQWEKTVQLHLNNLKNGKPMDSNLIQDHQKFEKELQAYAHLQLNSESKEGDKDRDKWWKKSTVKMIIIQGQDKKFKLGVEYFSDGELKKQEISLDPKTGKILYFDSFGAARPLGEMLKDLGPAYSLVDFAGDKVDEIAFTFPAGHAGLVNPVNPVNPAGKDLPKILGPSDPKKEIDFMIPVQVKTITHKDGRKEIIAEFIRDGVSHKRNILVDEKSKQFLYIDSSGDKQPLNVLLDRLGPQYYLADFTGKKATDDKKLEPLQARVNFAKLTEGVGRGEIEFLVKGELIKRKILYDVEKNLFWYVNSRGETRPLQELFQRLDSGYYLTNNEGRRIQLPPVNEKNLPPKVDLTIPVTNSPWDWDKGREGMNIPRRISESECQELTFDNRDKMANDTDQRNSPLCWAHASAGLLEEQICLAQPMYCGQMVARTEVVAYSDRKDYAEAITNGSHFENVLSKYLEAPPGGDYQVCLDKYAKNPFDLGSNQFLKDLNHVFTQIKATGFCPGKSSSALDPKIEENLLQLLTYLEKDKGVRSVLVGAGKELSRNRVLQMAQESFGEGDFIKKVLLYYCQNTSGAKKSIKRGDFNLCVQNTLYPSQPGEYDPFKDKGDFAKRDLAPYLQQIKQAKNYGHSLGLSLCYAPLVDKILKFNKGKEEARALEIDPSNPCGGHAVLANAFAWNSITKRCEIFIKNSHGEKTLLPSSWFPAEIVLPHVFETTYYGKTKMNPMPFFGNKCLGKVGEVK